MPSSSSFYADGETYDTSYVTPGDVPGATEASQAPSSFYPEGDIYDALAEESTTVATMQALLAQTQASQQDAANHDASAASHDASAAAYDASSAAQAGIATTQAGIATTQAGIATTKAGQAATSASNAATSETNAASSASNATTQAGVATTQAGIATTQAGNAATSAANAQTTFDTFRGTWYGNLTADPVVDPLGAAINPGDVYFNTTSNFLKVYNGTIWGVVAASTITSVFGRTGAVVAQSGDYTFAQIGSKPTTLSGYGITDTLTNTVFGRSGAVTAQSGDYTFAQLGGLPTTLGGYGITDAVALAGNQTITGGYKVTPNNLGNITSFTINPVLDNYQYGTNHGAATWTAPANDCAVDILVTNDATAGAITFSGFTVGASTGDALTTTNTQKFIISIRRINSVSTYTIKALQ